MTKTNRQYLVSQSCICHQIGLIVLLSFSFFGLPASEAADAPQTIARAETIQRMDWESEEQFTLRKQRITYGTLENRRYCDEELGVNVGLCKGGSESVCFMTDLYKAYCVGPGQSSEAAVAKLPARSREDYFDRRDGRWLTRTEYCGWLAQQPIRLRNASWHQNLYAKNCGALPGDSPR